MTVDEGSKDTDRPASGGFKSRLRSLWSYAVSSRITLDDFLDEPLWWRRGAFLCRQFITRPETSTLTIGITAFALAYVLSAFSVVWLAIISLALIEIIGLIACEAYEQGCWNPQARAVALLCGASGIVLGYALRAWRCTGHGGPLPVPDAFPVLGSWAIIALPAFLVAMVVAVFAMNRDIVDEICCGERYEIVIAQSLAAFLVIFTWGMMTSPACP